MSVPCSTSHFSMFTLILSFEDNNKLTGTIPRGIANLSQLKQFNICTSPAIFRVDPLELMLHAKVMDFKYRTLSLWSSDTFLYFLADNNDLTGSLDSIFCHENGQISPDFPELTQLRADCSGDFPDIECSCCECFFRRTE